MTDNGRLLDILLTAGSVREAAKRSGISERTIYRRLADPDFRAELNHRRREAASLALNKLRHDLAYFIETLKDLSGDDHPDSIRVRAVTALLEAALKSGDLLDLQDRVERLEDDGRAQRDHRHANLSLTDLGLEDEGKHDD